MQRVYEYLLLETFTFTFVYNYFRYTVPNHKTFNTFSD